VTKVNLAAGAGTSPAGDVFRRWLVSELDDLAGSRAWRAV